MHSSPSGWVPQGLGFLFPLELCTHTPPPTCTPAEGSHVSVWVMVLCLKVLLTKKIYFFSFHFAKLTLQNAEHQIWLDCFKYAFRVTAAEVSTLNNTRNDS